MTLQYEVSVQGLITNGHPHQLFFTNLTQASKIYEELCKKHPDYDVKFSEYTVKELKLRKKREVVPEVCPKGHGGSTDGKSILRQGANGFWVCGTCGDRWLV